MTEIHYYQYYVVIVMLKFKCLTGSCLSLNHCVNLITLLLAYVQNLLSAHVGINQPVISLSNPVISGQHPLFVQNDENGDCQLITAHKK